jgi:GAF domain-containing protein
LSHEINKNTSLTKSERYKSLIPQIKSLVSGESDLTANLGNICAALKYSMDNFFWVGFYFKWGDELVLGSFQGPVACTRFKIPQGVCGACVQRKGTIIVPDVNKFPGHIACNQESKSEIVVPVFNGDEIYAVLDIDSNVYSNFDDTDKQYLEEVCILVSQLISAH